MSALENVHYGFGHHYKWLSPQMVPWRYWFWTHSQCCLGLRMYWLIQP